MTANSAIPPSAQMTRSKRKTARPVKTELTTNKSLEEADITETLPESDPPQDAAKKFNLHPKEAVLLALGLMPIPADIYNNNETEPLINKKIALQCQQCKEYFKTQTSLKKHCAEDHSINLYYYCKYCAVLFQTRADLQAHKAEAHNGQKPYTCTLCPLSFISLDTLTAHVRRHNGKAPYTCKICKDGFDLFKDYKAHKAVHELVKPKAVKNYEKKYACKVCERAFRKPCDLQRHIRVHTGEKPFACSVCGNRFQQTHNLTKHMIIHTKEKQFECDLCKKIFGRNDVLRRHMLTHSIQKPFVCKFCKLSFSRNSQLDEHVKKYHPDDAPPRQAVQVESEGQKDTGPEPVTLVTIKEPDEKKKSRKNVRKRNIKVEVLEVVEEAPKRKRGRPKKVCKVIEG